MRIMRVVLPSVALGFILQAAATTADQKKVTLCHVPPGDPSQRHTLVVAANAASSHLGHHPSDTLGPCPEGCTASSCDDNDLCTTDVCEPNGSCSHTPVSCDDGNDCTADSCLPASGCHNNPVIGLACDDGDVCTSGDVCGATGQCAGGPVQGCCHSDADCSDGTVCTTDSCDVATGACSHTGVVCPPAPPCFVGVCDSVNGCTATPLNCDDADPCTVDSCEPSSGQCVYAPNPVCCVPAGEPCASDADCCIPLVCGNNTCVIPGSGG